MNASHWQDDTGRKARIDELRRAIAAKLDEIAVLYRDEVKVTLVVRCPAHPDGRRDTIMTDDDPEKAVAALRTLYGDPQAEFHVDGVSVADAAKIGRGLLHD